MRTHESEEMYLETILLLREKRAIVRSIDLAEELGYITIDGGGDIALTQSGHQKAAGIYERHLVITKALMTVGADKSLAEENACRIEHVISNEMFELLKKRFSD